MGVPVKSNNTQQGCNPISSNCVIWQGPDIPCITLCTGDSVSDVVAKMATELCEITDQLNISLLDLSCFNPLYPTPQNFQDVMQIILNKVCALENGTAADGTSSAGCPSDCIVTVAPCLQTQDYLGNTITTMSLQDYVILIGNRICTILTSIAGLQLQIDNLNVRVTNIENNTGGGGSGSSSFNVTSECVTQGSVPLQEYINALDLAFCLLQANTGTTAQFTSADSASACVNQNSVQMANPPQIMGGYQSPPWIASPQTAYQHIQNLWVAICDIRTGLTNLREQLTACCAPSAPCPTNLPIPQIYLNKSTVDDYLYFRVSGNTTGATTPNAIVLGGEEWVLSRFEGTVVPSATGVASQINVSIPNITFTTQISYTNSDDGSNPLASVSGIGVSIQVQALGTFYWKNVTTNQECGVSAGNNPTLVNQYAVSTYGCPSFGGPSPSLSVVAGSTSACSLATGGSVTVSVISPIAFLSGPGVTQSSMPVSVTYTNTSNISVTQQTIFNSGTQSFTIPSGIKCGTTVSVSVGNISQGNAQRFPECSNSGSVTLPAGT
jgi:hypothetical protein